MTWLNPYEEPRVRGAKQLAQGQWAGGVRAKNAGLTPEPLLATTYIYSPKKEGNSELDMSPTAFKAPATLATRSLPRLLASLVHQSERPSHGRCPPGLSPAGSEVRRLTSRARALARELHCLPGCGRN